MQIDQFPFYAFSPEDRLIKRANKIGLVTREGRATSDLQKRYSNYSFKLNPECRREILSILLEKFKLKGRTFLHIETCIQEISLEIGNIAKKRFGIDLTSLFIGGGLLKPLKPLFIDFFSHFGMENPIGAHFHLKLSTDPRDYDFQFIAPVKKLQNYKVLVDEGIVTPLASKMNRELTNLKLLSETLWASKEHAKTLPTDSYLYRVFEEHPKFNSESPELFEIAVKALGFKNASDSRDQDAESGFYFRNIASSEKSYDCFFPKGLPSINSLCIDITECENEEKDLYLGSLQGKGMVVQAIIDANFLIHYTDQSHPANELDLARLFCLVSQKKRWFGHKSLLKAFNAFEEERIKRKLSLSEMLPQQLISRAKNHHSSGQAAEVITFNACAILMCLKPELEDEIQKVWQRICELKEQNSKQILYTYKDPFVEHIYHLMKDSKCSFRDLLSQIQASSFLLQHQSKEGIGKYKCRPSQSEDQLFTQIVINFSQNSLNEDTIDTCTLFFPFALAESINHLQKLADDNNPALNSLRSTHDLLTSGNELVVGINRSILHKSKYYQDPRRHYSQTIEDAEKLLASKNPYTWKLGFLLLQAHIAMNNDGNRLDKLLTFVIAMLLETWPSNELKDEISDLLQEILRKSDVDSSLKAAQNLLSIKDQRIWNMGYTHFLDHPSIVKDDKLLTTLLTKVISMLLENWPKDNFKIEMAQLLQRMLKNSNTNTRTNFFQRPTLNFLIGDLLSTDNKAIQELGRKHFKKFEDRPHDEVEQLYFDLINSYFQSKNRNTCEDAILKSLLTNLGNSKLKLESTLKIFITLINKIDQLQRVENELLESIWACFQKISSFKEIVNEDVQKMLSKFVLAILKSEACKRSPHIGLSLANKVHRLKIFDKKADEVKMSFKNAVSTIHHLTSSATEINPIYSDEEFDALSDFMQTYNLQSLHSLKVSISRRITTNSGQIAISKVKEILHLLTLLIESQVAWNERYFIIETLNALPAKNPHNEIGKILELFSANVPSSNSKDLAAFYFDLLTRNGMHGRFILQLLLDLLCKEISIHDDTKNDLCNEDYIRCSKSILHINSQNELTDSYRDQISEYFLQQLYHRRLWNELINIFVATPRIPANWSAKNTSIFIQTFYHAIELSNEMCGEDLKTEARKVLMELPTNFELSLETKSTLNLLLINSQNVCLEQTDFLQAVQWSEKSKLIEGLPENNYKNDFQLLCQLATQGKISACKKLLNLLYHKEGNPSLWLKFFNVLIHEAKASNPFELFENPNSPPGKDNGAFLQQWSGHIPELLSQCREFVNVREENRQLEKQGTYQLTHQIFCWSNPAEKLWIEYIQLASKDAPKIILEALIDLLAGSTHIKINLSQETRILCWDLVLDQLKLCCSSKFLKSSTWWHKLWMDVSNEPLNIKRQFIDKFITGAANALLPFHTFAGNSLPEKEQIKDQSKEQISDVGNLLNILNSEEISSLTFPKEEFFDCLLNIHFAKICWFSEIPERKLQALKTLRDVFIYVGDTPQVEQKAVLLFNTFIQTMPKFSLEEDVLTALVLTQKVQQSICSLLADHFNILRFLKEISTQKFEIDPINLEQHERLLSKLEESTLYCISSSIKTLFIYSSEKSIISPNQKKLVSWGINSFHESELSISSDLVNWCLQLPHISIYLDKNEIAKLEFYKDKLKDYNVIFKMLQIYEGLKKCTEAATSPIERWNYLRTQGRFKQFQLQGGEKSALYRASRDLCSFFSGILAVMTIASVMFAFARK